MKLLPFGRLLGTGAAVALCAGTALAPASPTAPGEPAPVYSCLLIFPRDDNAITATACSESDN